MKKLNYLKKLSKNLNKHKIYINKPFDLKKDILIIAANTNLNNSVGCKIGTHCLNNLKKTYKFNYRIINLNDFQIPFYKLGMKHHPEFTKLIKILNKYSNYLFIFPNWLSNMPAVLKNFFDWSTFWGMKKGDDGKLKSILHNKKAAIITTCSDKKKEYIYKYRTSIDYQIGESTFKLLKIEYKGALIIPDAHKINKAKFFYYSKKVKSIIKNMLVNSSK